MLGIKQFSLILIIFAHKVYCENSLPATIKIGALFTEGDEFAAQEAAFRHAVDLINADRHVLARSRLTGIIEKIAHGDSFRASQKVCQMLRSGVVAIVGPTDPKVAAHVQAMSDVFRIPHIETRFDYSFVRPEFSINIHPHPSNMGKAYSNLLEKLNWKSLVILYENEDSLVKLQEVLKLPNSFDGVKITMRQLYTDTDDHRPLLKEIKKSGETRIILDCPFHKIDNILRQADEIGLISDYHNYLVTNLNLERLNLSPYKYNNVNITGFRLVDTSFQKVEHYLKKWNYNIANNKGIGNALYTDNVLMYDAVRMVAKALDDISATADTLRIDPIQCEQGQPWLEGDKLMSYIQRVEYHGISGELHFDMNGYRTDFKLELLEKQRDHLVKTGLWTPDVGVNYTRTAAEGEAQIVEKLQNKTLRVTTLTNTPFVIMKSLDVPKETLERMSFEEKYEGYVLDLVKHLSEELKFKYKFQIVGDGKHGNIDKVTGEWNGMIRELQDQKADIAVIDLSITSQRQKAVDFTMPFMNTGVGILYKKKAPPPPNLFSFLSPFSIDVWIYTVTAYLATSILMFLQARLTPYEWSNPHPCKSDPDELETQFNLINALWFAIGSYFCQGSDILPKFSPYEWVDPQPWTDKSNEYENTLTLHNCFWHNWGAFVQQGSDIAPKAISTRMVAGMWWFFTLIMISSYTANLAAFLTAAKMEAPINSAEDLTKQTKIKYGTYCCGSTNAFFKGSTIPTYQKLNAVMESAKPSVYTSGNSEGIDRVRKEDGMYAFFMEAAVIEYHIERKCDLTMIGGLLDSKGYGIALPPGSPYTSAISAGILSLQEKGILQMLKMKWWKEMHGGGKCIGGGSDDSAQLGLANLGGVFIVLLGGMISACIIAVGEFMWENRLLIADENESIWAALWKELKFALDIRAGSSKPVEKENSSDSGSQSDTKSIDKHLNSAPPSPPSPSSKAESRYGTITEDNKRERNGKNYQN